MRTHGGKPFNGVKGSFFFIIFRFVDNLGFLRDIAEQRRGTQDRERLDTILSTCFVDRGFLPDKSYFIGYLTICM